MDNFLQTVQTRALRMAELATGQREEALDLVQEAMMALVKHYAHKPAQEWPALFYRLLQNRIRDWYRRNKVRRRWFAWLHRDDESQADPVEQFADSAQPQIPDQLHAQDATEQVTLALERLPLRQQQAFLLRYWEGLSVQQTARAMACSEGSVKTHTARALARLRAHLMHWQDGTL